MTAGQDVSEARALTDVVTRLRRAIRRSIRSDYPWETMPMARVELMQAMSDRGPARVGELARALRLAPNTVSGLVQALVDAGMAVRSSDAADRRASLVELSPTGVVELSRWGQAHEERLGAALGALPASEQAVVRRALHALSHLVDRLEAQDDRGGG
jgi:DNA-binding MarR family transcriptional regulator